MGLIKAAFGAAGGVMADQWKEFFYCEAIPADVLAVKGKKKVTGRSSNTKGDENIITNGSVIAVADGQCMLIVEQGKIVDMCAEPGEYTYDMSTEPSLFTGDLGESIKGVFQNIGKRFTFGGEAPKDQRVYYFNTKELTGNKYGTPSPVPFRVVDQRAGIDIDIAIRCFGEYSIRLKNPMLFYTNVCGNVSEDFKTEQIAGQMKTELLTALQPAFAKISEMGIRYSALPGHTLELAEALNEQLSSRWRDLRGMEIVSFGVSSVKANEEDEQMIKELQRNAAFMDPTRAAAHLVGAQASAMQSAASNQGAGPAMAFMGMGLGTLAGLTASCFHILVHACCKPLLFSCAGRLSAVSGHHKSLRNLRGSAYRDIAAGLGFTVGALSMIGIPLFGGFVSKLYFASASLPTNKTAMTLLTIALSTVLNALYYVPALLAIWVRPPAEEEKELLADAAPEELAPDRSFTTSM